MIEHSSKILASEETATTTTTTTTYPSNQLQTTTDQRSVKPFSRVNNVTDLLFTMKPQPSKTVAETDLNLGSRGSGL